MRCWHKQLLPYLPRQQLIAQWRECCLIAKNLVEAGTPNHILVNRVMQYPPEHFELYCIYVHTEMTTRNYQCNYDKILKYFQKMAPIGEPPRFAELFSDWHNDTYLRQCLYNLEEKAICGGIPAGEWQQIYNEFKYFTPLWCG